MECEYWGQFIDLEEQEQDLDLDLEELEYKIYIKEENWTDDTKLDKSMLYIIMSMSLLSCMLILI